MGTVEVFFAIGDRTTRNAETGVFNIDFETVQGFINDSEEANMAFKLAAKVAAKRNADECYPHATYGFWISDEECEKHDLPDSGISKEKFLDGFWERLGYIFIVMEHTVWEDGSDFDNCVRAFDTKDNAIKFIKGIVTEKSGIMESDFGSYTEIDENQGRMLYEYTVQMIPFIR